MLIAVCCLAVHPYRTGGISVCGSSDENLSWRNECFKDPCRLGLSLNQWQLVKGINFPTWSLTAEDWPIEAILGLTASLFFPKFCIY